MTDNVLEQAVKGWARTAPARTTELSSDKAGFGHFWQRSGELLARLPAEAEAQRRGSGGGGRDPRARARLAHALHARARARRLRLADREAQPLPARWTSCARARRRSIRAWCRTRRRWNANPACAQGDKDGLEVDQGIFLSQVLGDPLAGTHLCHAMLLPREESHELLPKSFRREKCSSTARTSSASARPRCVTMRNPRYLNAEDETTLAGLETAIDLALLDPHTEICVLRGDTVTHTKHAGKRLFGAGINLTHLYQGKIRFLWYLLRDLGLVNKLYRGLALPEVPPEEDSIEKLWIAAVEGFAIGGHCQILLTIDQVIAAQGRLHDAARAQGRHHPGRGQPAPAAPRRRRASRARRSSPSGASTARAPRAASSATTSSRPTRWISRSTGSSSTSPARAW